ncbi:MAG: Tim44 domain-containing protein [Nitratireductor sp.]|nr:Tim44 domain-containing protein [Nitratireductor sp.]
MSDLFDATTIITIVIAVFILLRLRSVLGQRTGHQPPPVPRQPERDNTQPEPENGNVVSLPSRGVAGEGANPAHAAINSYAEPGTKLNSGLMDIASKDPSFEPESFLSGAKMAYEMIVTAFADGDRKALKNLLSKEVYEGFAEALDEREKRGETVRSTFVGIEKSDIRGAAVAGNEAQVTVQFISQIISSTHDSNGEVIDGDPDQVAEVNDVWTFARSLKSRDPNWKLIATESDE